MTGTASELDWCAIRGIITSAYLCFRTTDAILPEYGHQLLHTFDLLKVFYGLGSGLRQNLDWTDFKRMLIFIPPAAEQAAILRFLDWATGRLERAIRAKRKVIALFQEQKQAIIHRAVTRGLDPAMPLKDSGIPWIGEIPSTYERYSPWPSLPLNSDGTRIAARSTGDSSAPERSQCHRRKVRYAPR